MVHWAELSAGFRLVYQKGIPKLDQVSLKPGPVLASTPPPSMTGSHTPQSRQSVTPGSAPSAMVLASLDTLLLILIHLSVPDLIRFSTVSLQIVFPRFCILISVWLAHTLRRIVNSTEISIVASSGYAP